MSMVDKAVVDAGCDTASTGAVELLSLQLFLQLVVPVEPLAQHLANVLQRCLLSWRLL
jgi:hypothetical protein